MRKPACIPGLQPLDNARVREQVAGARATAQPLHGPADEEVNVQFHHIERDCAHRLVGVEDDKRAVPVGLLHDGPRIDQFGSAEEHVRDDHKCRPIRDSGQ